MGDKLREAFIIANICVGKTPRSMRCELINWVLADLRMRLTCKEGSKDLPDGIDKARGGAEGNHILRLEWVTCLHPITPVQDACSQ